MAERNRRDLAPRPPSLMPKGMEMELAAILRNTLLPCECCRDAQVKCTCCGVCGQSPMHSQSDSKGPLPWCLDHPNRPSPPFPTLLPHDPHDPGLTT
jgi:hypothetical protein